MRMIQRLNPGPGIADFWTEFKRPNPYRWPVLGGSVVLTAAQMYLLTDHPVNLNWAVVGVLALIVGVVVAAFIAEHVRIRMSVLLVAVLMTFGMLYSFTRERVRIPTRPPEVTYITTFAPGRSEAEIEASNAANQKQQDALRADQAAREEEAKDAYRALGRATGLDVDAMEREIKRDEARERAASSGVADRKQ